MESISSTRRVCSRTACRQAGTNENIKLCFKALLLVCSIASQARAHVVLTRDDHSQSLVLSGDDGGGGKDGGGGERVVIAGSNMGGDGGGGGQDTRMIMQNADDREGDIVMSGRSMIIPGEDGHIVLADGRSQNDGIRRSQPFNNPFMLWTPYMGGGYSSLNYLRMMPFFG